MRILRIPDGEKRLAKLLDGSRRGPVILTRRGHPAAVLIGVEGMDWEQVLLQTDDSFWRLIQRRRKERAAPLATVRRRLGVS